MCSSYRIRVLYRVGDFNMGGKGSRSYPKNTKSAEDAPEVLAGQLQRLVRDFSYSLIHFESLTQKSRAVDPARSNSFIPLVERNHSIPWGAFLLICFENFKYSPLRNSLHLLQGCHWISRAVKGHERVVGVRSCNATNRLLASFYVSPPPIAISRCGLSPHLPGERLSKDRRLRALETGRNV